MQVAVLVTPKAGKDEVAGWHVDANGARELHVKVTAAPEKGKATKAVGKVLAAFFGVPKSSVTCVRGETSRHKMFELPVTEEDLNKVL
jgi:uncharacterized protein (TIGR00251 family)